jgi:hypothetical protein
MYAQLDGRDENQSRPVRVETKISTLVPVLSTSGSSHAACACLCLVSPYTLRFDIQNILTHAHTHTQTQIGAKSGQVERSRRLFLFAELCGRGRQRREDIILITISLFFLSFFLSFSLASHASNLFDLL